MSERIDDKIEEIKILLEQLLTLIPAEFEEYSHDYKTKAACERYIERITEAIVDLVFLVFRAKKLKIPEDEKSVFQMAVTQGIITADLSAQLKNLKGMRNILAHEYGIVDDEVIYKALKEELERDVELFLLQIQKFND